MLSVKHGNPNTVSDYAVECKAIKRIFYQGYITRVYPTTAIPVFHIGCGGGEHAAVVIEPVDLGSAQVIALRPIVLHPLNRVRIVPVAIGTAGFIVRVGRIAVVVNCRDSFPRRNIRRGNRSECCDICCS